MCTRVRSCAGRGAGRAHVREEAWWALSRGSGSATRSVGGTQGWRGGGRGAANTTPLFQGGRRNPCPFPGGLGHVGGRRLGRNEVPFNLGAQEELLTCHWHLLILKRKNPASQGIPRRERWGRGRRPLCSQGLFPKLARPRPSARPRPLRLRGVGQRANGKLSTSSPGCKSPQEVLGSPQPQTKSITFLPSVVLRLGTREELGWIPVGLHSGQEN